MSKSQIRPRMKLTLEKVVNAQETAAYYKSGILMVYATPAMIAFMEKTSLNLVQPYLDKTETTVGIEIEVKHLKPTAVGKKIRCTSEITAFDGAKVLFDIEVREGSNLIGTAVHARYIIDIERFMKKLA
jgi:fluoroacetyl-CoA thioesterase